MATAEYVGKAYGHEIKVLVKNKTETTLTDEPVEPGDKARTAKLGLSYMQKESGLEKERSRMMAEKESGLENERSRMMAIFMKESVKLGLSFMQKRRNED